MRMDSWGSRPSMSAVTVTASVNCSVVRDEGPSASERVCGRLVVGPLAERAVGFHEWLADVPALEVGHGCW
jgi:hypothetical protein